MTKPLAGPQTLLRALNGRAILESLARRGPLTRADLMRETGLSRTAVTQVLRMLDAANAVAEAGVSRDSQGPAATKVALHPHLGFAAAVHVDHHAAHVVLVDPTGKVRAERHAPFASTRDRAAHITALIDQCRAEVRGPIHLVVVGVPGIVTSGGGIRDDQGPDGGAFRAALAEQLGCPVRIENDVNLAALAELHAGSGENFTSFALLLLDTAIGAGIVLDGSLRRGVSGMAGEVTYLPQTPLPIGAPVLDAAVVADLALAHGRDPAEPLSVHLDAAADGDKGAERMVAEMARRLVTIAGTVALVLDPQAFILAGAAAHPAFSGAVLRIAEGYADQLALRFVLSSFGPEAPLIGAVNEAAAALRVTLFTRISSPRAKGTR